MAIQMVQVNSSDIAAIGYDHGTEKLRVQFHSGGTYEYEEVAEREWENFRTAPSLGRHFRQYIKGAYRYAKVVG